LRLWAAELLQLNATEIVSQPPNLKMRGGQYWFGDSMASDNTHTRGTSEAAHRSQGFKTRVPPSLGTRRSSTLDGHDPDPTGCRWAM